MMRLLTAKAGFQPEDPTNGARASVAGVIEPPMRAELPALPEVLRDVVVIDPSPQEDTRAGLEAIALAMRWIDQRDVQSAPPHNADTEDFERLTFISKLLDADQIRIAKTLRHVVLYVDERYTAHPALLMWRKDASDLGFFCITQPRELKELREDKVRLSAASNVQRDSANLSTLNAARDLILHGAALGASDLHILLREDIAEVQYRVKGALRSALQMSRDEGEAYIRSMYTGLSSVKEAIYNPFEFQDAQINGSDLPGSGLASVRIIRGPAYPVETGGGFLVARLQPLKKSTGQADVTRIPFTLRTPRSPLGSLPLKQMGYSDLQVRLLERMTRMPSGVIVVTGPTGSGKTTTLYELLKHQARQFPDSRQITIENPVEYPMDWSVQLPVTKSSNLSFGDMVRMTLRMDPDVVLVGELRSADEAVAALQEAMTGHLVWTTLHVNDPFMTIDRMEMLDRGQLSREIICDHKLLRGFVAQRLVPVLCDHCKRPLTEIAEDLPADMLDALETWGPIDSMRVRGAGCDHCHDEKIQGVTAVAEVVETSAALMRDFIKLGTDEARRQQRQREGADLSMLSNAMVGVLSGRFDPRDVERAVDIITTKGAQD